jgi:hypothetical protein
VLAVGAFGALTGSVFWQPVRKSKLRMPLPKAAMERGFTMPPDKI